jgi:C-terminal processing protease CtpA/Prc
VGDVLVAVDGEPVAAWYTRRAALQSGSERFKRWRVRGAFLTGAKDAKVRLRLARGAQAVDASLAYDSPQPIGAPRRPQYEEVRPGIYYVDLARIVKAEWDEMLPRLAAAKALVFDLRGYPNSEAKEVVRYWIRETDVAQWMNIPRFDQPFAAPTSGWSVGWQLERDGTLDKPAKALLLDGRAVSRAESFAAYFPAQKAGPVVGEASAGANGDVASATLPGGMRFHFTGMLVTRHDGTLLHGEGIKPDIEAQPTPEGIRAGRDEVLERALEALDPAKR